jgi:hypothetical protein
MQRMHWRSSMKPILIWCSQTFTCPEKWTDTHSLIGCINIDPTFRCSSLQVWISRQLVRPANIVASFRSRMHCPRLSGIFGNYCADICVLAEKYPPSEVPMGRHVSQTERLCQSAMVVMCNEEIIRSGLKLVVTLICTLHQINNMPNLQSISTARRDYVVTDRVYATVAEMHREASSGRLAVLSLSRFARMLSLLATNDRILF